MLDHSVHAFWFASKQTRNELNVFLPRGTGGSSQSMSVGQEHKKGPQVALHRVGVDQLVHEPNCDGHVLDAWQVPAVVVSASRIASGSLLSAAFSIAGVGGILARLVYSGVSPVASSAGSETEGLASGARPAGGSWAAPAHAHRLHAIAMTIARARMVMISSSVFGSPDCEHGHPGIGRGDRCGQSRDPGCHCMFRSDLKSNAAGVDSCIAVYAHDATFCESACLMM